MTKREAAELSIFTGVLLTDYDSVHKLLQEILGRKVYTHELADKSLWAEAKERIRKEVEKMCEEAEDVEKVL